MKSVTHSQLCFMYQGREDDGLQERSDSQFAVGSSAFLISQGSARPLLHRRHCVEVAATLGRDRDLLPDVGQMLQVWGRMTQV